MLEPALVAVPLITPVLALIESPAGSDPLLMLKVYGALPPLGVTAWLYALPTVAAGKVVGLIRIVGHAA